MSMDELLDGITADELANVCGDLVRFKTVNPPGDEQPAADYALEFLRQYGFEGELVSHGENRASLIARLKGGKVPALVFNGHLDVVPVGAGRWTHDPFEGVVADGRVWGRGSADMKGGVAAMLVAAQAVATAGLSLRGDLVVTATAGEEVDMLGAQVLSARPDLGPMQAVIISEPTSNRIGLAERGVFWLEFTTRGKTAHGSTPELGNNAITLMRTLLDELDRLSIPYTPHPVLGHFTRSINTIQGGIKTNVVPDHCAVTVDMRTVPGQDHRALLRQLEDLIADLTHKVPDFQASVRLISDLPAVETSPDEPVVQRFRDVMTQVTGRPPEPQVVRFATEAAIFVPALHVPTIICGPGNADLAHQPDEYIEIDKMVEAARMYALAAAQLLAGEPQAMAYE
jgi:succinyl-diaminopimelate desuccinylase